MTIYQELIEIYGIGPKLAKELEAKLKKQFPDSKLSARDMLKSDPYLLDSLPISAKADLAYNPSKNIPRSTIDDIKIHVDRIPTRHMICGSYRRKKPISRDIDLVVTNETSYEEIEFVTKLKFTEAYSKGPDKASTFLFHNGEYYKLDIFIADPSEFPFMILYATGSAEFNVRMRALAKRKGLTLNQKGLFDKKGKKIKLGSEMEIFKYLGMKWLEPHQRIK